MCFARQYGNHIEDITRPLFFSLSLEFPIQSYDILFLLLNGSIWHLTHWRIFLLLSLNDSMEHGWRLWDNHLYRAPFLLSTSFPYSFVNFIISSRGESKWSRHSYEPIDDNEKGKKPWWQMADEYHIYFLLMKFFDLKT